MSLSGSSRARWRRAQTPRLPWCQQLCSALSSDGVRGLSGDSTSHNIGEGGIAPRSGPFLFASVLATAPRSSPFLLASMLTMSPTLEIRPLHPAWHAHQCHGSRDLNLQGMDVAAFQIPWDPAVSLSFPHLSSLLSSQIQWDPSMQICFGFDFIILTSSSLKTWIFLGWVF